MKENHLEEELEKLKLELRNLQINQNNTIVMKVEEIIYRRKKQNIKCCIEILN